MGHFCEYYFRISFDNCLQYFFGSFFRNCFWPLFLKICTSDISFRNYLGNCFWNLLVNSYSYSLLFWLFSKSFRRKALWWLWFWYFFFDRPFRNAFEIYFKNFIVNLFFNFSGSFLYISPVFLLVVLFGIPSAINLIILIGFSCKKKSTNFQWNSCSKFQKNYLSDSQKNTVIATKVAKEFSEHFYKSSFSKRSHRKGTGTE